MASRLRFVVMAAAIFAGARALVVPGGAPSLQAHLRGGSSAIHSRARRRPEAAPGKRGPVLLQGGPRKLQMGGARGSSDETQECASPVRRRLLLGTGLLGLAVMGAPEQASAGYGSGVSTTVSPPPIPQINLDEFFSLSEKKRTQIINRGKRQIKKLLGELDTLDTLEDAESNLLKEELEDQELLLRLSDTPPLPEFGDLIDRAKNEEQMRDLVEKVKKKSAENEVRRSLEKQLQEREQVLAKLEAQPTWVSRLAFPARFAVAAVLSSCLLYGPPLPISHPPLGWFRRGDGSDLPGDGSYSATLHMVTGAWRSR